MIDELREMSWGGEIKEKGDDDRIYVYGSVFQRSKLSRHRFSIGMCTLSRVLGCVSCYIRQGEAGECRSSLWISSPHGENDAFPCVAKRPSSKVGYFGSRFGLSGMHGC